MLSRFTLEFEVTLDQQSRGLLVLLALAFLYILKHGLLELPIFSALKIYLFGLSSVIWGYWEDTKKGVIVVRHNSYHLLNVYSELGTTLSAFCTLSYFIIPTNLCGMCYIIPVLQIRALQFFDVKCLV